MLRSSGVKQFERYKRVAKMSRRQSPRKNISIPVLPESRVIKGQGRKRGNQFEIGRPPPARTRFTRRQGRAPRFSRFDFLARRSVAGPLPRRVFPSFVGRVPKRTERSTHERCRYAPREQRLRVRVCAIITIDTFRCASCPARHDDNHNNTSRTV